MQQQVVDAMRMAIDHGWIGHMPSLTTTSVAMAQMVRNSKMASKAEKDALVQAIKTLKRQNSHLKIRHDCYKQYRKDSKRRRRGLRPWDNVSSDSKPVIRITDRPHGGYSATYSFTPGPAQQQQQEEEDEEGEESLEEGEEEFTVSYSEEEPEPALRR